MYGIITKQLFEQILKNILFDQKRHIHYKSLRNKIKKYIEFSDEEMKVNLLPNAIINAMGDIDWEFDSSKQLFIKKSREDKNGVQNEELLEVLPFATK